MYRRTHRAERRIRFSQRASREDAARIRHKNVGRTPVARRRADAKIDSQEQKLRPSETLHRALDGDSMKSNPRLHAATTKMLRLLCWQAVLLLGANAFADVVLLKDGRQITGIVELGFSSQIRLRTGDKSEMISIDRIQSIQFDPLEGAPPQTVGPQRAGPQATGFQG